MLVTDGVNVPCQYLSLKLIVRVLNTSYILGGQPVLSHTKALLLILSGSNPAIAHTSLKSFESSSNHSLAENIFSRVMMLLLVPVTGLRVIFTGKKASAIIWCSTPIHKF